MNNLYVGYCDLKKKEYICVMDRKDNVVFIIGENNVTDGEVWIDNMANSVIGSISYDLARASLKNEVIDTRILINQKINLMLFSLDLTDNLQEIEEKGSSIEHEKELINYVITKKIEEILDVN